MKRLVVMSTIAAQCLLLPLSSYAFESQAQQAVLMDYGSGKVIYSKNADVKMTPSSMTKLVTLYIAFDLLKKGVFKLEDNVAVSEKAWRIGGSRMFIEPNKPVSIEELIDGIVVQSGNDATIAIAEAMAGSEEEFVQKMNDLIPILGLTQSHFTNVTGWPDENHYMSAQDIATVSQRLIEDFPEYYHYFSKEQFTYNNITQHNRNLLINAGIGVDGLKTGHTEDGGYGVAVSAKEKESRLIAVVNGLTSMAERSLEARKLLEYGFRFFTSHTFYKAGQVVDKAPVYNGQKESVELSLKSDVSMLVPKLNSDKIKTQLRYQSPLLAPIKKGQEVGTVEVVFPDGNISQFPLVANDSVAVAGVGKRLLNKVKSAL